MTPDKFKKLTSQEQVKYLQKDKLFFRVASGLGIVGIAYVGIIRLIYLMVIYNEFDLMLSIISFTSILGVSFLCILFIKIGKKRNKEIEAILNQHSQQTHIDQN